MWNGGRNGHGDYRARGDSASGDVAGRVLGDTIAAYEWRCPTQREQRLHLRAETAAGVAFATVVDRLRARVFHASQERGGVRCARRKVQVPENAAAEGAQPGDEGIGESLTVRLVVGDDRGALDVEIQIREISRGGSRVMPGERQIDADAELGAGRGGCAGGGACPANHQEDGRTQPGRALHAGEDDSRCEAVALRILSIPS